MFVEYFSRWLYARIIYHSSSSKLFWVGCLCPKPHTLISSCHNTKVFFKTKQDYNSDLGRTIPFKKFNVSEYTLNWHQWQCSAVLQILDSTINNKNIPSTIVVMWVNHRYICGFNCSAVATGRVQRFHSSLFVCRRVARA